MSSDAERPWTQDHYVTRNSTTDDPSGYRCWMTCRCGWGSGTLPDGNLPTTHRAELEHYVSEWERSRPVSEAEKESATNAVHRALAARWMSVSDALGGDQADYEALLQDMATSALEAAAKVRAQGGNHE